MYKLYPIRGNTTPFDKRVVGLDGIENAGGGGGDGGTPVAGGILHVTAEAPAATTACRRDTNKGVWVGAVVVVVVIVVLLRLLLREGGDADNAWTVPQ